MTTTNSSQPPLILQKAPEEPLGALQLDRLDRLEHWDVHRIQILGMSLPSTAIPPISLDGVLKTSLRTEALVLPTHLPLLYNDPYIAFYFSKL